MRVPRASLKQCAAHNEGHPTCKNVCGRTTARATHLIISHLTSHLSSHSHPVPLCVADNGQRLEIFSKARSAASQIAPSKPVVLGGATKPTETVAGVATRVEVAAAANSLFNHNKKMLEANGFASVVNIPHEQPLTITHHDVQNVIDSIKEALAGATAEARAAFSSNFTLLSDNGYSSVEDVPVGVGRDNVSKKDVLDLVRSIRSEDADGANALMSTQEVVA